MIVCELLKERFNAGAVDNLYYWRDKTGNEVDVLIDRAGKLTAMELKAGETISTDFFKGLDYFSSLSITCLWWQAGAEKKQWNVGKAMG
jgi:hypothetical protein